MAERAAEKARIVRGLAEQRRLLSSVRSQIASSAQEACGRPARGGRGAGSPSSVPRRSRRSTPVVVGATVVAPGASGFPSGVSRTTVAQVGAGSSRSPSSTSACPTCSAPPARTRSTAPGWSRTSTRRSGSLCHTSQPRSGTTGRTSRSTSSSRAISSSSRTSTTWASTSATATTSRLPSRGRRQDHAALRAVVGGELLRRQADHELSRASLSSPANAEVRWSGGGRGESTAAPVGGRAPAAETAGPCKRSDPPRWRRGCDSGRRAHARRIHGSRIRSAASPDSARSSTRRRSHRPPHRAASRCAPDRRPRQQPDHARHARPSLALALPERCRSSTRASLRFNDDSFVAPGGTRDRGQRGGSAHDRLDRHPHPRPRAPLRRAGVSGSGPGLLNTPDDAYPLRTESVSVADAYNCRVLWIRAHEIVRQLGETGVCRHDPPATFGSFNGDTPLPDGGVLISEITGQLDRRDRARRPARWSVPGSRPLPVRPAAAAGRADPDRRLLSPGARRDRRSTAARRSGATGRPGGPRGARPSVARDLLPNGNIAVNDDYRDRVVVIDPCTQSDRLGYGHTDAAGQRPGIPAHAGRHGLRAARSLGGTRSGRRCTTLGPEVGPPRDVDEGHARRRHVVAGIEQEPAPQVVLGDVEDARRRGRP